MVFSINRVRFLSCSSLLANLLWQSPEWLFCGRSQPYLSIACLLAQTVTSVQYVPWMEAAIEWRMQNGWDSVFWCIQAVVAFQVAVSKKSARLGFGFIILFSMLLKLTLLDYDWNFCCLRYPWWIPKMKCIFVWHQEESHWSERLVILSCPGDGCFSSAISRLNSSSLPYIIFRGLTVPLNEHEPSILSNPMVLTSGFFRVCY
jgi:hypothetical protein